jgi:hypothetical protein
MDNGMRSRKGTGQVLGTVRSCSCLSSLPFDAVRSLEDYVKDSEQVRGDRLDAHRDLTAHREAVAIIFIECGGAATWHLKDRREARNERAALRERRLPERSEVHDNWLVTPGSRAGEECNHLIVSEASEVLLCGVAMDRAQVIHRPGNMRRASHEWNAIAEQAWLHRRRPPRIGYERNVPSQRCDGPFFPDARLDSPCVSRMPRRC